MKNETDLSAIKKVSILLLMIKVHETEFSPVIVKHPFTDSGIAGIQYNGAFKVLNIVGSSHDLSLWLNFMERKIEEADSLLRYL